MSNQRKQQPEKISADCPHCGFSQLESAYAKSTICRRCSQPFSIEKLLAKEVSSLKAPSFFDKLGKMISRESIREIRCFSCDAVQEVSSSAESSLCPKCGSYIDLRDFKITGPFGRSIQTQGEVIISNKGDATSQRILCGRAYIEGKMRGQLMCTDTVSLRTEGRLMGSIESDKIVVERKCDAELVRPVKVRTAEINGTVRGNFLVEGRITINKHGNLNGIVYARSIVIEKGGVFYGELHIGEPPEGIASLDEPKAPPAPEEEAEPAAPQSQPTTEQHLPGLEPSAQRPAGGGKPKLPRRVATR